MQYITFKLYRKFTSALEAKNQWEIGISINALHQRGDLGLLRAKVNGSWNDFSQNRNGALSISGILLMEQSSSYNYSLSNPLLQFDSLTRESGLVLGSANPYKSDNAKDVPLPINMTYRFYLGIDGNTVMGNNDEIFIWVTLGYDVIKEKSKDRFQRI